MIWKIIQNVTDRGIIDGTSHNISLATLAPKDDREVPAAPESWIKPLASSECLSRACRNGRSREERKNTGLAENGADQPFGEEPPMPGKLDFDSHQMAANLVLPYRIRA